MSSLLYLSIVLCCAKSVISQFGPDLDSNYDIVKFLKRRQATAKTSAKLTVDPPKSQIFSTHLSPQAPSAAGDNPLTPVIEENVNRAVRLQQPVSNFPASISAGGSPQNPALFSRTTFQPGSLPQGINRPSIQIAPSPVRPEIITVPLTTLTRESGAPPAPPPLPAPAQPSPPPPPPVTSSRIIPTPTQPEIVTIPSVPVSPPLVRTPPRVVATPSHVPKSSIVSQTPQSILFTRPPPTEPPSTIRTQTTRPKTTSTTTTTTADGIVVDRERPSMNPRPPFVAPNGKTLLNPHAENYCDIRQYPDEALSEKRLQRVEYFVANLSCSRQFFECAVGQTYLMNCTSNDQVFDIGTTNCNFRSSVKACPEFDNISHCTIKEQCQADQFACCAMPQQCIPFTKRCDGVQDCSDGEDENNCPSCDYDEFPCVKTGKCIKWSQRCNGIPDECFDQTNLDEHNCQTCGPDKFLCSRSEVPTAQQSICLDVSVRCNGVKECPKGEDELNCKTKGPKVLLCEDQKQSVNKDQWCDGTEDCIDGSDEQYCVFK